MTKKRIFIILLFCFFIIPELFPAGNDQFELEKISERIFALTNRGDGTSQLAVKTSRGVVVLNSFWAENIALKFKKGWEKIPGGKDFIYNINTTDRIDIFGGNSAYKDIPIIGHESFINKFTKEAVDTELNRLIKMWRWKEDVSRKRLPTHKKGSKKEKIEIKWMNTCKQRADQLESGFSLLLPTITYSEKMTLTLGDTTMKMIWFGKAGYDGISLIVIPEEKTLLIPGFLFHPQHLAPHPNSRYTVLDVPRWIKLYEEIFKGENGVDKVIINAEYVWTTERALSHVNYIKKLWQRVKELEAEGKNLKEVQELCSIDKDFSFVKNMQVYKDGGDDWIRPQHKDHIMGFYFQLKSPEFAEKTLAEFREQGK